MHRISLLKIHVIHEVFHLKQIKQSRSETYVIFYSVLYFKVNYI